MLTRVLKILSKKFKSKNIFLKKQKNCDIRDLSPMIYIINIFFIYFHSNFSPNLYVIIHMKLLF